MAIATRPCVPIAVTVAVLVATVKGSLVACYFMHLIYEKKLIPVVMAITAAIFVALLALPSSPTTTASGYPMNLRCDSRVADPYFRRPCGAVGIWCLGVAGLGKGSQASPRRSRLSPWRSAWWRTTCGPCAKRGRCDDLRVAFTTAAAVFIVGSSTVLACPVCFGPEETSMIDGSRLGILALLVVTFAVQGAFVGFFLSPQTREAHCRHRPRRGMVGAPGMRVEHDD